MLKNKKFVYIYLFIFLLIIIRVFLYFGFQKNTNNIKVKSSNESYEELNTALFEKKAVMLLMRLLLLDML